jgi:tRNA A37 methylthiotransferase MiaB
VRQVSRKKNAALVGSTHEVLVERPAKRGSALQCRTRGNKIVLVDLPHDHIGRYITVRLTGTTGSTFTGAPAMPASRELAVWA